MISRGSLALLLLTSLIVDVASWLRMPRLRKEHTLCQENIDFMKDALEDCVRNCSHYKATNFLPSRLLDLGSDSSLDTICLIQSNEVAPTDDIHAPRYAALSYCWGLSLATNSVRHLRTTIESLESMKQRIHQETIPLTIMEAIKVCKVLSIRYLWVDSLCILQDHTPDWERESQSMTSIYRNAFVTIYTPSSEHSDDGFLERQRKYVAVPFQSQVVPSINGHYNLVASGEYRYDGFHWPDLDIRDTPWSKRGWTLQEFQMSNRVLIFGKSMVHFQCLSAKPENVYQNKWAFSDPARMVRALETREKEKGRVGYYDAWQTMLENYGRRLFTFVEDKLPAISGMAKYISDETGDEYLAGLWKSRLPSSLVWSANCYENTKYCVHLSNLLSMLHSPAPYITPSWSPIRLDVSIGTTFTRWLLANERTDESTVVDARVESMGGNPFGRVQSGRIRIRGRLAMLSSDLIRLACYRHDLLWYTLDQGVITYYKLDYWPIREACSQEGLLKLLIYSMEPGWSFHSLGHGGSPEKTHKCLTEYLPLHKAGPRASRAFRIRSWFRARSWFTTRSSRHQTERENKEPESGSDLSHSRALPNPETHE